MFFTELTPIFKELTEQPITFMGGLVSGFLRLNPNEDPLKSWLSEQGQASSQNNSQGNAPPKTINID